MNELNLNNIGAIETLEISLNQNLWVSDLIVKSIMPYSQCGLNRIFSIGGLSYWLIFQPIEHSRFI
jgi:hypothetical protein